MDAQGTIKLMDGLYVGDESSARDEELILLNRVAVVLNLTSLPNYFLHYGVIYPHIQWPNADPRDIVEAIVHAKQSGQSVLIHGEGNLDAAVGAGALFLMQRYVCEYEERFRWSLFKTLEFVASRVEGLAFSQQSFEILKRHELSLLNEEARLSYNWEQRPTDADQLILRNTYLNSTQKDKVAVSSPIKSKPKEKRRISWMISAPEGVKAIKQPPKTKDTSLSIRNQVLMSVRKILNKQENTCGGNSSTTDQKGLPLKKYKSTYTLTSLSSIQRLQKLQEIPVVSLNLTENNEKKSSRSQISIKRVKTEGSEAVATRTSQPQIVISLKKESEKKVLTHRRASDSLKKLRQTQQTRKLSSNYQNLR